VDHSSQMFYMYSNIMEDGGMRVNINKTKIMISVERQKLMQKATRAM